MRELVSIHAPARGATSWHSLNRQQRYCFNPRARAGRDCSNGDQAVQTLGFNPRARAGRDSGTRMGATSDYGFNPRARAGRDAKRSARYPPGHVSIHAPARGATQTEQPDKYREIVSIHAPARGATVGRFGLEHVERFQSTRPRGARPQYLAETALPSLVSIHAPARGATSGGKTAQRVLDVSIHAPARGATFGSRR